MKMQEDKEMQRGRNEWMKGNKLEKRGKGIIQYKEVWK